MTAPENILTSVEHYVLSYLKENLPSNLTFHNVHHTLEVVHAVKEIGTKYPLTKEQLKVIQIAAWFHDCGYAEIYIGHEDVSKKIANDFLRGHSFPATLIETVLTCIEGTRYPQNPITLEAKILCDADLYHFTKPDYHCYEQALRIEHERYFKMLYSDKDWADANCKMLKTHQYFTDYGMQVLQKFKEINIDRMECKSQESHD
ncbi:MAG: HD domain-containing protein [Daejeonella sp.]